MSQVYFISDIHGFSDGLLKFDDLVTSNKSRGFILGDLFDHNYGEENKIIDCLYSMLLEDKCIYILGNHDTSFFSLLFNVEEEITQDPNVVKVLENVYTREVYDKVVELLNMDLSMQSYYTYVDEITRGFDVTNKLKEIFNKSNYYYDLKLGNKLILLTHCGHKEILNSRDILNKDYKLEPKYDFGIMGHMTTPYLLKCIDGESNPINHVDVLCNKHTINDIEVLGEFHFIKTHNTFLIDDGSHNNIFTLYNTTN